ncbi:MAG: hypothetical protein ACLFPF_06610 [Halanaerobiales bacterium]
MKKSTAFTIVSIIIAAALLISLYFYKDYLLLKYSMLKQVNSIYIPIFYILFTILVVGILLFIFYKFEVWDKIKSYYKLKLNGLIILEAAVGSGTAASDLNNLDDFKESLENIRTRFNYLDYNIDFGARQIKIKIKTDGSILLKDADSFLGDFTEYLNNLLGSISAGKLIINVSIDGQARNVSQTINFTFANKGKQIGLNKNITEKNPFKLFYVHR